MGERVSDKVKVWALGGVLAAACLVVFGPTVRHGFVGWDDDIHIYENPHLDPVDLGGIARFWKTPYRKLYIPATYTVWAGISGAGQLAGRPLKERAPLFHAANVLVHVLNVLLVFSLLRTLAGGGGSRAAFAGAALFALHPVQVEAVAWASGMKDLLCALFAFAALRLYISAARASAKRRPVAYGFAAAAFLLAGLSKPAAVALPLIALVIDRWILRRDWRNVLTFAIPWAALALPLAVIARTVQPVPEALFQAPLWARPFIALDSLAFYLRSLLLPAWLAPDYGRTPELFMRETLLNGAWLVPPLVLAAAWRHRSRWGAPAGVFILGLLPVIGLAAFNHQVYSTVADRYLYLPMLGVSLLVSGLASLAPEGERAGRVVAGLFAAALLLLGAKSAAQARRWSDTVTLFGHVLEVNPRSSVSHNNLGCAKAELGRWNEVEAHYRKAVELAPKSARARVNLANLLVRRGRRKEAVEHYRGALDAGSPFDRAQAHSNLGVLLARARKLKEAEAHYLKAVELKPDFAGAYVNLGLLRAKQDRLDEAAAHFRRALSFHPDDADAHNGLGNVLVRQGRADAAGRHFLKARRIRARAEEGGKR